MNVRKSAIVWSAVLIILSCNVDVDAAKASRRGGTKTKTPNYDHVALSYGGSHGHNRNTHHDQARHQHQNHQQFAPSAPVMPSANNNNHRPAGWAVPAHNTPEQAKTVQNTQSALPYPQHSQNPPAYTPNAGFNGHPPAGPPPPYSANPSYNSHVPAGPPPPYSQNPNTGFHSNAPIGQQQPPAYQPNGGAYPMHNTAGGGYPQQPYNGQPAGGSYPQQSFVPQGQQAPVVNNFYGQPQSVVPQSGGSSGGGFLQTALAAGAGSLAGNALYGALKPDSEHKTVIIHENAPAPAAAPAAAAPAAPVAPVAPVAPGEATTVAPVPPVAGQPAVQPAVPPQTDVRSGFSDPLAPNVPLAPLPDQTTTGGIPLAPISEITTNVASSNVPSQETTTTSSTTPNQTVTSSTNVPLAPFPDSQTSQAQKSGATTFAIFNLSVCTIISVIIASIF